MIYDKLLNVQKELKAPKSQRNNFGNYNYRSCEDILEAAKPILAKNGLLLVITDEITEIGGRIYVKATATVYDGKELICASAFAREEETKKGMDASQVTGAASSYARKYALNGLFCIDDTKDSDATNTHGKEKPEPKEQKPKEEPKPEAKEETVDIPAKCESCGNTILPQLYDGKKWTAEQIIRSSKKKYGKALCWDCAMNANAN